MDYYAKMSYKKNLYLMCEDCYNLKHTLVDIAFDDSKLEPFTGIFNFDFSNVFYCRNCNAYTLHFDIDENVANLVSILNKNGIATVFSCEGHAVAMNKKIGDKYTIDINYPYISINCRASKNKELLEKITSTEYVPDTNNSWIVSKDDVYTKSHPGHIRLVFDLDIPDDNFESDEFGKAAASSYAVQTNFNIACQLLEKSIRKMIEGLS